MKLHLRVYRNEYPLCTGGFSIYITQAQTHREYFCSTEDCITKLYCLLKTTEGKEKKNTQNSLGWSRSEGNL